MLVAASLCVAPATALTDPTRDVLWVALQACKVNKSTTGRTFPCLLVDLGDAERPGSAVLRAPDQRTHIVVIPTQDVIGVEAPELQGKAGNTYWRAALAARHFVAGALHGALPIEDVAMAVNSRGGRSQDQLHIHADCVAATVRAALDQSGSSIGRAWAPFPTKLQGNRYFAMKVSAAEVDGFNPFVALKQLPGRQSDLRNTSVAIISSPAGDAEPGFYILAYRWRDSHAEALLDHSCSGAKATAAR